MKSRVFLPCALGAFALFAVSDSFAAPLLIDFGKDDGTNGNLTASPDVNGHHWNNMTGPTLDDLVDTGGVPTPIDIQFTTGFSSNGILNGGLLAPSAALLGDFAIPTATEDYYFTTTTLSFTVKGLDPSKVYQFRMFGTRETTGARTTRYTAREKSRSPKVDLATSGAGIGDGGYDGNNDTIVTLQWLLPDAAGEIEVDATAQAGGFGYLGAMEISEFAQPGAVTRWVAQDALDPVAPGSVLFVGSSSIRRWEDLSEAFADYRILQRGFGGSQFEELISVTDQIVIPYAPAAIVLWEGTNDLTSGESASEIVEDYQTFVSMVQAALPTVEILYLGITPTPSNGYLDAERTSVNSQISAIAGGDSKLHYVDLPAFFEALTPAELDAYYVDPVHLNRAGYEEWRKIVRPALEAVLAPNKVFTPNPQTPQAGGRILFDLGPDNPIDGDQTGSPDSRSHHWNNWHSAVGDVAVNAGERLAGVVDADGNATGVRLIVSGGFVSNGKVNGGLQQPDGPDFALLGDLAVETATQDYFFSTADGVPGGGSDDTPGGLMLDGLDPALEYEFRFFGSRALTSSRVTEWSVSGANQGVTTLETSGTDIGNNGSYDGNDDEVAVVSGIRPDAFGQVFIDQTAVSGGFAYLNALEVRVSEPPAGIAQWRADHFDPTDLADPSKEATLWGDGADPDHDGLANLWEYFHGLDPLVPEAARTVAAGPLLPEVIAADPKLIVRYTRPTTPPADVLIEVLTGDRPDNLALVSEGVEFTESAGTEVEGRVPVTLEFSEGAPDAARQFMALRATIQP
ncbi:GDSL-type esterase/lipase family protein [Haloferula sp.]|uniref:GDSL-type esterase/lipase family protein n=1 Tax=Haloferula sp. TaxID=2497595 RepID=UPI003C7108F0